VHYAAERINGKQAFLDLMKNIFCFLSFSVVVLEENDRPRPLALRAIAPSTIELQNQCPGSAVAIEQ